MEGHTAPTHWVRILLIRLGLAAAYVLMGWPGLLLAVPPGYATAIFLPAGLALSAVPILGPVCLPGVFLGSLVLNVCVGYTIASGFGVTELTNAIVIAGASTLQAGMGGVVLRRAIGQPALLDQARDLLWFLLLAPVLCITSATLSVGGMWALGAIGRTDLLLSWAIWWIGDTLGVLVVLPLVFAFFGKPRSLWRPRAPYIAVPMIVFFGLFVAIFVRISTWESDKSLLEFRTRSQHLVEAVRAGMEQQGILLQHLGDAFNIHRTEFTIHDFQMLTRRLPNFPIVEMVGWAPRIAAADRAGFELAQSRDWPGFRIGERDAGGMFRPAATRADFYPLTFLEPLAGNQAAIGFDIASDPKLQTAIETSIASRKMTATAYSIGFSLKPEDRARSILLTYAIEEGSNGPGILISVLRPRTLFETLLLPLESVMGARFIDVDDGSSFFDNLKVMNDRPFFETEFAFGMRRYLLLTQPTGIYLTTHRGWESWSVLVVGVFATGLLGALLLLGSGHAHRIQRLVDERTSELQVANRRLTSEMMDRERAESALQRARHMEAIGQFTGGMAHDFNNLLQVVLGNLEMLRRYVAGGPPTRLLSTAQRAAERGARLVESLLAFARRQTLKPEIVDANRLISDFGELIRQAVGPAIELRLNLVSHSCWCRIDPAQFQSAMLNLVVNARDAMPRGGLLTIESRAVGPDVFEKAGQTAHPETTARPYFVIILRDNGSGMTPEVFDRAFEPFFTTKDIGQGSGLGLSQVYGFVKQSDGHIDLNSKVDSGTEVIIYLPLVDSEGHSEIIVESSRKESGISIATILVVEDDPDVRQLMVDTLQELGFGVLAVADGQEALSILNDDRHIDLLFSDILLPNGMRGDELGRRANLRRSGLKVLLTTGYADERLDVIAESTIRILRKPFRRDELAEAIRVTLNK